MARMKFHVQGKPPTNVKGREISTEGYGVNLGAGSKQQRLSIELELNVAKYTKLSGFTSN